MSDFQSHPLQRAFLELRDRDLPLGLEEYLLLLKALSLGLCGTSRVQLISLCQSLWAHSLEERALVEATVERFLPVEFAPKDLERWLKDYSGGPAPAAQEPGPSATEPGTAPSSDRPETEAQTPGIQETPEVMREPSPPGSAGVRVRTSEILELGQGLARELAVARQRYELQPVPPVLERQMRRAWRYYRKSRRTGPKVRLDIEATIRRVCREGVLAEPALIPRAANAARLLILQDVKGSMVPFDWQLEHLVSSASVSGIQKLKRYYFHDVPGQRLGLNSSLSKGRGTDGVLQENQDAGVLILSDAGAARGNLDPERIQATRRFLDQARQTSDNIAWMNPMPVFRWKGTTAEEIRRIPIPMFPFNRSGLFDAIDALRGRVRVAVV